MPIIDALGQDVVFTFFDPDISGHDPVVNFSVKSETHPAFWTANKGASRAHRDNQRSSTVVR